MNATTFPARFGRRRFFWFVLLATVMSLLAGLWLVAPSLIKQQAEATILAHSGHTLRIDAVRFNPITLRLELGATRLTAAKGEELASFSGLVIDLSATSLFRRAWVFDQLQLVNPRLRFEELPAGRNNWTGFLQAWNKDTGPSPKAAPNTLPPLLVHELNIDTGELDYADHRDGEGFSTRMHSTRFLLREVSTRVDEQGDFSLEATVIEQARLALNGRIGLAPLRIAARMTLTDLDLAHLAPVLEDIVPGRLEGRAQAAWQLAVSNTGERVEVRLAEGQAKLDGLHWRRSNGGELAIERVELAGIDYDLAGGRAKLDHLALHRATLDPGSGATPIRVAEARVGQLTIEPAVRRLGLAELQFGGIEAGAKRQADGRIDLVEALAGWRGAPSPASAAPAWSYAVGRLELGVDHLTLRDAGVDPPADFHLREISVTLAQLSEQMEAPVDVELRSRIGDRGRLAVQGKLSIAGPRFDMNLRAEELPLTLLQPYVAARSGALLAAGRFSAQGRLRDGAQGPRFQGKAEIADLGLVEATSGDLVLAWRRLATPAMDVDRQTLDIPELVLTELQTRVIVAKDKTSNFSRLGRTNQPSPAVNPGPKAGTAEDFSARVGRLRIEGAGLYFADESLFLPFATRIHGVRGSIAGIGSRPGVPGVLEIEGQVEDFGLARAAGRVDLLDPSAQTELKVVFRNVDMPRLSPYSTTFAGHHIDSGRLNLDLDYRIRDRELAGENQIVIEKLKLGERVASPAAFDLPLNLAIALLEDSEGRIDLGVPISGRLDDPQFSFSGLIWKALGNVLFKVVSSPFRALGALFSQSDSDIGSIHFEPGEIGLTPPEREKLLRLARAMAQRPALRLQLGGGHAAVDREALRDRQLRRTLLAASGETLPEGDPGPVALDEPKLRSALETTFAARFGAGELTALREGFRAANPGQSTDRPGAGMVSRLSGMLGLRRTLAPDEVAALKGLDFGQVLFLRLKRTEAVADEQLVALARARATHATELLRGAGLAAERMAVAEPVAVEAEGEAVALRVDLAVGQR